MSVKDDFYWDWALLPTTLKGHGLDEFQGMQFAYPRRDYVFSDWHTATELGDQGIGRTFRVQGFTGDAMIMRSGPELFWDDIIDNIPVANIESEDAVELYSVEYPDSHLGNNSPDQLVVKAVRTAAQYNKKISTATKYGNSTVVSLGVFRKRFSGGNVTYQRLTSQPIRATVYQPQAVDVLNVETRLEFIYTDYNWLYDIINMLGLSYDDPAVENLKLGDFMLGISSTALVDGIASHYSDYRLWYPQQDAFDDYISGLPTSEVLSDTFGLGANTGGYDEDPGSHDFHSDDIVHSGAPQLSALSSGFVNAYKVTSGLLTDLGKALFPQKLLSMDATGLSDAQVLLKAFRYLIDNQHNKGALDFIIDCHIVPVNVPTSGTRNITAGGTVLYNPDPDHPDDPTQGTPYPAPVVSGLYVSKSCGSITTPEAFGNFLDYTVRCKLYLPFYGYVDIPPEYWNGGTLSVEYMFNIFDGTFVAFVNGKSKHSNLNSLIGQYSGVACTHIPISSRDYSQIISGIVSLGIGVAGTVAGGEIAGQLAYRTAVTTATMGKTFETAKEAKEAHDLGRGVGDMARSNARITTAGQAVSQAASGLSNVLSMKPSMCNNGTSNSSSAMMMHKKPYLIIEYPTPQFSVGYPDESGLPLNVFAPLGSYGGMTIAENPVLDGIPCTAEEKDRIRMGLASGLIFR